MVAGLAIPFQRVNQTLLQSVCSTFYQIRKIWNSRQCMRLKLDTCENQFIVQGWTELVSGPRPIYAMKCNFLVRVLLLSHVLLISSQLPTVDPAQNPARPLRQWWGGQLAIVRLEVVGVCVCCACRCFKWRFGSGAAAVLKRIARWQVRLFVSRAQSSVMP